MISLSVPTASLGVSAGQELRFDIYSSSQNGSDGAIDSLSNPSQTIAGWQDAYEAEVMSSYTVVPEPGTFALLAIGGVAIAFLRWRKA